MRTKLPSVDRSVVGDHANRQSSDEHVRDSQALSQLRSREAVHEGRSESNIEVGKKVVVKSNEHGKQSLKFDPTEVQVAAREGSEVVLREEGGSLCRRNISEVKPAPVASRPKRYCGPPTRYGDFVSH